MKKRHFPFWTEDIKPGERIVLSFLGPSLSSLTLLACSQLLFLPSKLQTPFKNKQRLLTEEQLWNRQVERRWFLNELPVTFFAKKRHPEIVHRNYILAHMMKMIIRYKNRDAWKNPTTRLLFRGVLLTFRHVLDMRWKSIGQLI